jgi:hypothetical protein
VKNLSFLFEKQKKDVEIDYYQNVKIFYKSKIIHRLLIVILNKIIHMFYSMFGFIQPNNLFNDQNICILYNSILNK